MSDRHSRFVRALEAEFEAAVAAELGTGMSLDEAQARAFEHVKARGAEALHRLSAAGFYPWSEGEAEDVGPQPGCSTPLGKAGEGPASA